MRGSVSFVIHLKTGAGRRKVFEQTLDPRRNPAHRTWSEQTLDLSDYAGQSVQIIFETSAHRSAAFAWSGWGDVCLVDEADRGVDAATVCVSRAGANPPWAQEL